MISFAPRLRRTALLVTLLSAASMAVPLAARAQDSGLPVGSVAPRAVLQTLDGRTVDLAQVAKGPSVIEFWATWCENCEHLLPAMKRAQAKYGKQVKFVAVAVSVNQSPKKVQLYTAKYGVPGEQLYDAKGEATDKWNVPATSHVVVLNRQGKVVYTGVGGDQNIEAAIKRAL